MDRFTKKLITACGLILTINIRAELPPASLGKVTQSHGAVTYLSYTPPNVVKAVKAKDDLFSEGSYLTKNDSFLTAKSIYGQWIRMSPKSKISLSLDHESKSVVLHLLSGSVKVLTSEKLKAGNPYKLIVRSGNTFFESSEGKFSIIRHLPLSSVNIYVEKGVVTTYREGEKESRLHHLHALETMNIEDKSSEFSSPRKMTEKEIKFISEARYLKL